MTMMHKRANLNRKVAEIRGVGEIVADTVTPTPSEEKLEELRQAVAEKSEKTRKPFEKKASSRNFLDVYGDMVEVIKFKLEVDDNKARELASTVISRATEVQRKFGMSLTEASTAIIEEMERQLGKGQVKVDRGMTSYQKQDFEIYRNVQQKIKDNFDITQGECDIYTKLVRELVQDFSIQFRGIPKERIADAIVNVAIKEEDITTIKGVKNSPFLETALRMELRV